MLYQRGQPRKKRNDPTPAQRKKWERIRAIGCIICSGQASIHHCETGMGGRKDHDKVIPLCYAHHQGYIGIHEIGRKLWQEQFGTEQELMEKTDRLLNA
jgi:hypothetical protein